MRNIPTLLIIGMLFLGCGKAGNVVPNVPVNVKIVKTDPRYTALNAAGGYAYVSGAGAAGIIIYRQVDGSYAAYDRCSSYQPEKLCAITVDDSGFTATDPCSGAKFSLSDGSPVKAPATKYLRSYVVNTTQFEIFVSN
jgi:nitrite reductase/ring-hydroxylating ferredoxin subunit